MRKEAVLLPLHIFRHSLYSLSGAANKEPIIHHLSASADVATYSICMRLDSLLPDGKQITSR